MSVALLIVLSNNYGGLTSQVIKFETEEEATTAREEFREVMKFSSTIWVKTSIIKGAI